MRQLFATLLIIWSGTIAAHEVHGSNVSITVKGQHVEVLQSTPVSDAQFIAQKIANRKTAMDHQALLTTMAKDWQVSAKAKNCSLQKQAFRLAHNKHQIDLRYLFQCPENSQPSLVDIPWLAKAPEDHFMILRLNIDGKSKTVVFQRQALSLALSI